MLKIKKLFSLCQSQEQILQKLFNHIFQNESNPLIQLHLTISKYERFIHKCFASAGEKVSKIVVKTWFGLEKIINNVCFTCHSLIQDQKRLLGNLYSCNCPQLSKNKIWHIYFWGAKRGIPNFHFRLTRAHDASSFQESYQF
jgi:hypothetical protein